MKRYFMLGLFFASTLLHANSIAEKMKNMQAQQFDKQGNLIQEIKMDTWIRKANETRIDLINPELIVHQADGSLLQATAKKATGLTARGTLFSELTLLGNVKVEYNHDDNPWELLTEQVSIIPHPKASYAHTDSPIIFNTKQLKIIGKGAKAINHSFTFKEVISLYEKI